MARVTTVEPGRYGYERLINVKGTSGILVTYGEKTSGDLEIAWMNMGAPSVLG